MKSAQGCFTHVTLELDDDAERWVGRSCLGISHQYANYGVTSIFEFGKSPSNLVSCKCCEYASSRSGGIVDVLGLWPAKLGMRSGKRDRRLGHDARACF
jgi:hypothetical protein